MSDRKIIIKITKNYMGLSRTVVFATCDKTLNEMLALRKQGATIMSLANKYNVGSSTIIFYCKEAGLSASAIRGKYKQQQISSQTIDGKIRPLKCYKEYLKELKEREKKKTLKEKRN